MRFIPTTILSLAVALAFPVGSFGAPPDASKQGDTRDARRERAIQLFRASEGLYREGRFEEAAELLREAYALDPAPTLLYNLARALESAGDLSGAATAYRDYLAKDPQAPDRPAIERRIENIDRQLAEREALEKQLADQRAPEVSQPPVVVQPVTPPAPSPLPWVAVGTGAAGLAAGAILGVLASGRHDSAREAPSQAEAATLDQEARGLARGANVAYVAGGVRRAGGLGWAGVAGGGGGGPLAVRPEAGGVTLTW